MESSDQEAILIFTTKSSDQEVLEIVDQAAQRSNFKAALIFQWLFIKYQAIKGLFEYD